jgi:chromate reductase, NAD(P)H dehydrogenase (quinone)
MSKSILIISGTNRPGSNAIRVSNVLQAHYAKHGVAAEVLDLNKLPADAFAPESYGSKPASVQALQKQVLAASGLHVVVPEYNGSFPGALKYFIDLLKFPESFERKPVAFVGEAAGAWGGLRAVEQLQHVFGYRNAHVYPVRVFITAVHTRFDAAGNFTDAELSGRLGEQCAGFAEFISKVG